MRRRLQDELEMDQLEATSLVTGQAGQNKNGGSDEVTEGVGFP